MAPVAGRQVGQRRAHISHSPVGHCQDSRLRSAWNRGRLKTESTPAGEKEGGKGVDFATLQVKDNGATQDGSCGDEEELPNHDILKAELIGHADGSGAG